MAAARGTQAHTLKEAQQVSRICAFSSHLRPRQQAHVLQQLFSDDEAHDAPAVGALVHGHARVATLEDALRGRGGGQWGCAGGLGRAAKGASAVAPPARCARLRTRNVGAHPFHTHPPTCSVARSRRSSVDSVNTLSSGVMLDAAVLLVMSSAWRRRGRQGEGGRRWGGRLARRGRARRCSQLRCCAAGEAVDAQGAGPARAPRRSPPG